VVSMPGPERLIPVYNGTSVLFNLSVVTV
jgi:hypothetical protein